MDNLFEIIFFLFIIFSFLSPLFKKKKEQEQQNQGTDDTGLSKTDSPVRSGSYQKRKEDFDILNELETLFKVPQSTEGIPETVLNEKTEADHYDNSDWHEPSISENFRDEEWHRPTTEADYEKNSAIIAKSAQEFQDYLKTRNTQMTLMNKKIRSSIRSNDTLKEYFLISEIIGKPVCRRSRPLSFKR